MEKSSPADRYHALDSLRAFAMFLGIVLHVAVSFVTLPTPWPVRDKEPTLAADLFVLAVHDFRMQLFFLLAGFFACLLHQRHGVSGMARHRFLRVAVPFALSLVFIIPTVQAAALYARIEQVRAELPRTSPGNDHVVRLIEAAPEAGSIQLVANFFLTGESLSRLPLAHLWFLYYLLFFYAAAALLTPVMRRAEGTRWLAGFEGAFRWVIESRARVVLPAVLTFPAMLPMRAWSVDTPSGWIPQWHILLYYAGFFTFGWCLYRQRDLVATFGRSWKVHLTLANLLVLPVMFALIMVGLPAEKNGDAEAGGLKLAALAASALYTWLMITGLWGAFLHWFKQESAWTRYFADASYWCYLASLTPIMILQLVVADWDIDGVVKIALVTAATMVVLLASYQWGVRYGIIGAILNGRKRRGPTLPAIERQNCELSMANVGMIANAE